MILTEEYRKILDDYKSSEEQIKKRLEYLETFFRNVIRGELENYAKGLKNTNQYGNKSEPLRE